MSFGGPLRKLVQQDSRNAAWLGNAIGWQGLENEGKYNTQNPGHAVTKAAESAALWYLGSLAGSAVGAGGAAADAANTTADTAATAGAQQVAQTALQNAPQGLGNTLDATLQDTGYTPSTLLNALKNASSANGTPLTQNLANYASNLKQQVANGGLLSRVESNLANPSGMQKMALNQGAGLLTPQQQPQPQPMPMRSGPQQQTPLPLPYQNSLTSGQSSVSANLPPPGMSYAEWLRRKQMGLI